MRIKFLTVCFVTMALYSQVFAQKIQWKNLFDGRSLSGWSQRAGTALYEVQDGKIVGTTVPNSPNSFLATEKTFKDFILEFDFMLEDSTINSGVQFRSHFDASGNNGKGKVFGYQYEFDPTARAWTGGIYDEGRRDWLYPVSQNPKLHNAYKPGVFNSARIECKDNYIRTFLNGMLVSQLVDSLREEGFIALQVHSINNPDQAGKKIYWKNIRIAPLAKVPGTVYPEVAVVNLNPNQLSEWEKNAGYRLLFDGKTSKGWKGAYRKDFPAKGWQISNGILSVQKSEGKESANGGDIVTTEKFSAFDMSFEFRLSEGGNSGVKYFVTLTENNPGSAIGLEYQLLDDKNHPDALLGKNGNRTLSSLYDLIPSSKQPRFFKAPGNWNRGRIVVYPDNRVEHYLNGVKVVEYRRGSPEYRNLVAGSKYKDWKNFGEAEEGHILLQDHGDKVDFRSLKIRKLK